MVGRTRGAEGENRGHPEVPSSRSFLCSCEHHSHPGAAATTLPGGTGQPAWGPKQPGARTRSPLLPAAQPRHGQSAPIPKVPAALRVCAPDPTAPRAGPSAHIPPCRRGASNVREVQPRVQRHTGGSEQQRPPGPGLQAYFSLQEEIGPTPSQHQRSRPRSGLCWSRHSEACGAPAMPRLALASSLARCPAPAPLRAPAAARRSLPWAIWSCPRPAHPGRRRSGSRTSSSAAPLLPTAARSGRSRASAGRPAEAQAEAAEDAAGPGRTPRALRQREVCFEGFLPRAPGHQRPIYVLRPVLASAQGERRLEDVVIAEETLCLRLGRFSPGLG